MTTPLPIKSGLNPTRAQVPSPIVARDFVWQLVVAQRHRHPEDDQAAVDERFLNGEVVLDSGQRLGAEDLLAAGTWINFYRRPAPERPVPGAIKVLYQDRNVLVVDKPPFLATLPRGQHITETALTKARVLTGNGELSPSHRLDRLTRGVLMFTARREVRGAYQTMFDRRLPVKTYEAITPCFADAPFAPLPEFGAVRLWDEPSEAAPWVLRHHMVKVRGRLCTYLADGEPNAVTEVIGLRQQGGQLVWTLRPKTGKTHQLRVAMRALGLPLVNDPLYSELTDDALTRPDGVLPRPVFAADEDFSQPLGLIAKSLSFIDPLTGQPREFTSGY